VNSIKARLGGVVDVLKRRRPDLACLQELKCTDDNLPRMELEDLGYNVESFGQKSYNGVAILSRFPLSAVSRGLEGEPNPDQARYIEAWVEAERPFRLGCLYAPNGNPVGGDKFKDKLTWLSALGRRIDGALSQEEPAIFAGDYNVIPFPSDAANPEAWKDDALFQPESRAAYFAMCHRGLTDALASAGERDFTFWDYQGRAFDRDHGIRIDHALLTPQLADRLSGAEVDREARAADKPSDHAPLCVTLEQ
jgi:exodeoxyribonuclease-3